MKVYKHRKELETAISDLKKAGKTIGFVPTMGALHDGHLSLIFKSLEENDVSVMSIFVNPTQFNNTEDLEKYPRTLDADVQKVAKVSEKVIIYAPDVMDIYGEDVISEKFDFDGLDKIMEGAFRPGHFDGVATIVKKLFQIVRPNKAYFGEKDFQQLAIIKKMVQQTQLDVQVIGCPIVRDSNGLALSSRNERLSNQMKLQASYIYQVLQSSKKQFETTSVQEVEKWVKTQFECKENFDLEYFTIADNDTLMPITEKQNGKKYRAFIVVFVEGVRLIDNIEF